MSALDLGQAGSQLGTQPALGRLSNSAGTKTEMPVVTEKRCLGFSPSYKSRSAESAGGCSPESACCRERGSSQRVLAPAGFSFLCPGDPAAQPGASASTKAFSFSGAHATDLLLTLPVPKLAQRQGRCAGRLTLYWLHVTKKQIQLAFPSLGGHTGAMLSQDRAWVSSGCSPWV